MAGQYKNKNECRNPEYEDIIKKMKKQLKDERENLKESDYNKFKTDEKRLFIIAN